LLAKSFRGIYTQGRFRYIKKPQIAATTAILAMPDDSPPAYVLHRTFADVDDLAEQAREWELDFRQLDRGRFYGDVLQFAAGGVHVSDARFCRSLQQKGEPPVGMRTIAVPARRDLRLEWRGKLVDGDSLMVFPRGSELSSVSGPEFHVYTCSFPDELLSGVGDSFGAGDVDDLLTGIDAIRVGAAAVGNLRRYLSRSCQAIREKPGGLSDAAMVRSLTHRLPQRLIAAIAAGREECPAFAPPKRLAALRRAEAFIEQHASCGIGVRDICQAAGVSERTLQYAFRERFGIGPKEFLNSVRLVAARRALRVADPGTTKVADVANRWGFWHMGQFAADYRRRFEELPSETLGLRFA
jgi:AraC-like DNA-binding protein